MNAILRIANKIQSYSSLQHGVFSVADLRNAIMPQNDSYFFRVLNQLIEADILQRFCRNYYVTEQFDPIVLSQRICPESYLGFGNILAENLLIGTVPKYRLMAVKKGVSRIYDNGKFRIEHLGIDPCLFTGYETLNGISRALPEKAALDCLYFYQKGKKFGFDVYSDVDYAALNHNIVKKLLALYKNRKFVSFVNGVFYG
jgi:hypothetical protein